MHYNGKGNDKALWDLEMEILWGVFEKGAVHPFKTSINQNDEWVKFDQIMYDKDHTSKTSEEWKTAILNCGVENIFLIDEKSNKQTYGISNEKGEFIVDFKFSVQPQNGDKNGRMHLSTINAEYYNNKNNFDMAKKYTKSEIEGMIKNLKEKEKKARSKWGKAVLQDAQWLLENVIELMQGDEINEVEITEKYLLNGAKNWEQFSVEGNALVYEGEIAEHYLTPSDLKSVGYDEANCSVNERPSERETWYELQARALRQAWWAIRDEMNGTTEFSMSLCNFSILDDTKDVLKATGKLAGNIVKNTTDKGGLLMF